MREETITLAIFEKYSTDEKIAVADQLAQAQADIETVKIEKSVSDAAYNERIKKLAADVSRLAAQYNKGGETAQIGCDIRYDHPETGKKSYFRMDRNELVETHDMSWEEKQETIQFPLTAAADAPSPTPDQVASAISEIADATDIHSEELTRLCPFPGCTLFAEHDGDHEIEEKPKDDSADAAGAA